MDSAKSSDMAGEGPAHPADRLCSRITQVAAPTCVGLDPVLDRLPANLRPAEATPQQAASAIESFCVGVLEAIQGHAAAVKFQSACFERYGGPGMIALAASMAHARSLGLITLLDAKRGDIGITASHYAAAARTLGGDWVTINGWLGAEGILPFIESGGAAFVLVRTSNPSGATIQCLRLDDGRRVADAMADLVTTLGQSQLGDCGFSSLGAVVGATHPAELEGFRDRMPNTMLLLPGYGAQGGTAEDVRPSFDARGYGALVTASRSIIYAFEHDSAAWADAIKAAAVTFADEIGTVAGLRS